MGALSFTAAVLRTLWPFIQETVFKNDTARQYLRKNIHTFIWFFISLVMFLVQVVLFDAAVGHRTGYQQVVVERDQLQEQLQLAQNTAPMPAQIELTECGVYVPPPMEPLAELPDLSTIEGQNLVDAAIIRSLLDTRQMYRSAREEQILYYQQYLARCRIYADAAGQ